MLSKKRIPLPFPSLLTAQRRDSIHLVLTTELGAKDEMCQYVKCFKLKWVILDDATCSSSDQCLKKLCSNNP